jgi:hypothetical protein
MIGIQKYHIMARDDDRMDDNSNFAFPDSNLKNRSPGVVNVPWEERHERPKQIMVISEDR